MSTLNEILQNIADNAPMALEEIIQEEVKNWERSDERKLMLTGQAYYKVKNDILDRRRKAIGENGQLVDVHNLADNRIPHGFIRKLVDQKTGYLLSRPFLARTEDKTYQDLLDEYFDKGFRRMLKNVGKNAINAGKAWLQVYYGDASQLAFKLLPSEEVIPLWRDAAHTELDAVIRVYESTVYEAKLKKIIKKIEFWNSDGVKYYEEDAGILRYVEASGHFSAVTEEADEQGELKKVERPLNWERLPFICFKYNDEEQPLIDLVKRQIDDYDRNISDNSNNLEDLPNSLYVVKDYDGTNAAEFRKNLSIFRVAFVNGTGGIDTVSLEIDTEAHSSHIEQLRKDIYEFGRGVDTQRQEVGNASGIALKFLYADLDMDANDMESEFQASLEQLLWFIDQHIANTTGTDYSDTEVEFIFNRDIIINETEAVTNAKNSTGIISERTVLANHPWVTNVDDEEKQIKQERESGTAEYDGFGAGADAAKDDGE